MTNYELDWLAINCEHTVSNNLGLLGEKNSDQI